jgi:hypothetical protein
MSFFASLERLTFYTVSVSLVKKQVNKPQDGQADRPDDSAERAGARGQGDQMTGQQA